MPAPGLFERPTLTGDAGGRRTALEERGVAIGLSTFNDVQSVVRGGLERRTSSPGLIEPTLGLDLDRLFGLDDTGAFLRGLGTYGGDPGDATGSLDTPSNLANAVATFSLFEGWVEPRFLDDTLSVRFGLYAADTEFDVREAAAVFMNAGFGTGIDLSHSGRNGPCIYPTSCLGARLSYRPDPALRAQVAVLDGVAGDPNDPRGTHVILGRDDGLLVLSELAYQRDSEEGGIRAALGLWYYSATFDDVLKVDAAGRPVRRHAHPGVYAYLEGALYSESGRPLQGLSAFIRAGMADQSVQRVRYSVGAGLAYTGLLPGRGEDVAALGVLATVNGAKYARAQRLAGTPVEDTEVTLEGTYWMSVFPWLSLQLDAQYVVDPGTDPAVEDTFVIGMRCRITH